MQLLTTAMTQIWVWRAYTRLGAPEDDERNQAMETLYEAGSAALPCLRFATRETHHPRARFAAAVVLHRLGEEQGMAILLETLQWKLQAAPQLAPELEKAFITIGPPDAVTALLQLWWQLPEWGDHQPTLESICRVWAALRDPRALEGLTARATRIPDLFLETIPWFGEMAVSPLERMTREPEAMRRILAIRALERLGNRRGFSLLVPLLRDPNPDVRAVVPPALYACGGPTSTTEAITDALHAGYSTREAVLMLSSFTPPGYGEHLMELIARWNPHALTPSGDTVGAVLTALNLLTHNALVTTSQLIVAASRLIPVVCELLERHPGAQIAAAAARLLGARASADSAFAEQAREALRPLLAHTDAGVRAEAAQALGPLREPLGAHLVRLLEECRPQGSFLNKLQAIFRGGPDAGQAATQAVLQMTQWLTRVSKETVERWNPDGAASSYAIPDAPRLPEILRQLLHNALDALERASLPSEVEEMVALSVASLRALARVPAPAALCARAEILRALHLTKQGVVYEGGVGPFRKSEWNEIGRLVRSAAAETLHEFYGEASFPLFLEALYSPHPGVQETGILALGRLSDARALPHLRVFANDAAHPCAENAREAIALIRRENREVMELLRASSPLDSRPDTLLRPASANPNSVAPDQLLRPTAQNPPTPAD